MNKYQKVASQVAKDMMHKELYSNWTYRQAKNACLGYFKDSGINIAGAFAYKNHFKDKWY